MESRRTEAWTGRMLPDLSGSKDFVTQLEHEEQTDGEPTRNLCRRV